jgi:hypothetical protein
MAQSFTERRGFWPVLDLLLGGRVLIELVNYHVERRT